jgi:hypothetical protein
MKDYDLYAVEWEYEDMLPKDLSDLEYDLMFDKSEVRDGVRMFPYITIYSNEDGSSKRIYLCV